MDLVVHVKHSDERGLYALERLWHDCPRVELTVPTELAPTAETTPTTS